MVMYSLRWLILLLSINLILIACEIDQNDLPFPTPRCSSADITREVPRLNELNAQLMEGHWEIQILPCSYRDHSKENVSAITKIESDLLILEVLHSQFLIHHPSFGGGSFATGQWVIGLPVSFSIPPTENYTVFSWQRYEVDGVEKVIGMEGMVDVWLDDQFYQLLFYMAWVDL